jgi:hypothetical protein
MTRGINQLFMARDVPLNTICLDGAATTHMVPHKLQVEQNILQQYTPFTEPRLIEVGGGYQLQSYGKGILMIGKYKLVAVTVDKLQFILLSEPQIVVRGGSVLAKDCRKIFYDDLGNTIIEAPLDKDSMLFLVKTSGAALLADSKPNNQMDLWHVRMGHPHDGALRRMVEATIGVKLPSNIKASFCETCHKTKSTAKPFLNEGTNDKLPLEELTVDTSEQMPTPRGFRYSLDMTCVGTTYGWTFPMRNKSDSEGLLKSFIEKSDRSIHHFKTIRFITSDHGGEFTSSSLQNFLREKGIIHQTGPANTPNLNPQERHNRTLNQKQRALLMDAKLGPSFWLFAREVAQILKNLTPTQRLEGAITPFESFHGRKPDMRMIRAFGSTCYAHVNAAWEI